ncbi:MAG: hypothetical protein V2A34_09005 [Lentisphaerota bacterium]
MFVGMLFDIFVNAFVLCGILFLVARHEADFEFAKVAMVSAFISLGNILLPGLLFLSLQQLGLQGMPAFGIWVAGSLLMITAFFIFMIMKFCWVSFPKALLVLVLFMAFYSAYAYVNTLVQGQEDNSLIMATHSMLGVETPDEKEADNDLLKQIKDILGDTTNSVTPIDKASQEPSPPPTPSELPPATASPNPDVGKKAEAVLTKIHNQPVQADAMTTAWKESMKLIKVTGTMNRQTGEPPYYVVNGRLIYAGESIVVTYKGKRYRWRLEEASTNGLKWRPVFDP